MSHKIKISPRTIIAAGYGYRSDGRRTVPDYTGTVKTLREHLENDNTLRANADHMHVQLFAKIDGKWVRGNLFCGVIGNGPAPCSLREAADPEYRECYGDVYFIADAESSCPDCYDEMSY